MEGYLDFLIDSGQSGGYTTLKIIQITRLLVLGVVEYLKRIIVRVHFLPDLGDEMNDDIPE